MFTTKFDIFGGKISPMSSNIAVIANNLLKISKLSLLRTIRLKCNKSNICKIVEFVLFRYEWELSPTQAIHMILLLFCFVDFNCLAAAAALENYNPLKIVNGYHRIYTYSWLYARIATIGEKLKTI